MRLNEIRDNPGATKNRKRVGRGMGSGTGKTSARGQKGQKSRSGGAVPVGFEGGQMPLYRRLPKRGFKNPSRKEFAEINLDALQKAVDAGKLDAKGAIDEAALGAAGLFKRRRDGVRLLGNGAVSAKLKLTVTGASKAAVAAIEKAGGSVTVTSATEAPALETKPAENEKSAKDEQKAQSAKVDKKEKKTKTEKKESEDGGSEAPSK